MNNIDLRQVGMIFGLPLYVDVSKLPELKDDDELLSIREQKALVIRTILSEAMNPQEGEQ